VEIFLRVLPLVTVARLAPVFALLAHGGILELLHAHLLLEDELLLGDLGGYAG